MAKSLARSGLVGAAIKFGGVGLGFLFFVAVARATSAAEYGIFGAAFSLATILGFGGTAGQGVAVLRFWPGLKQVKGEDFSNSYLRLPLRLIAANIVATIIIGALFSWLDAYFLWFSGNEGLVIPVILMTIAFILSEFFVAVIRARGSLIFAMAPREIAWRLLTIAVLAVAPSEMSGATALEACAICLVAVTTPQAIFALRKFWAARRVAIDEETVAEHRHATWGLWGVAIAMPVTQHFSTVVVALALGPVAAGAYFAADRLAKLLTIPMFGVNQVAAPELSKLFRLSDRPGMQVVARSASNFAAIASVFGLIGFILLGQFALSVFNPEFASAYYALLMLALGQLVASFGGANEMLLQIAKQERIYLAVILFWGGGSIVLCGLFALKFGLIGAAVASCIGITGRTIHTIVLCKRRLDVLTLPGWR